MRKFVRDEWRDMVIAVAIGAGYAYPQLAPQFAHLIGRMATAVMGMPLILLAMRALYLLMIEIRNHRRETALMYKKLGITE